MAKQKYKIIEIKAPATGITYIYEDFSYWDKEKGYSTHKRKSIGKLDAEGNRVYNKYYLDKLAAIEAGTYSEEEKTTSSTAQEPTLTQPAETLPTDSNIPEVSYTILMGQKLLLDKVSNQINIRSSLLDAFSTEVTDSILALSYYVLCQGKAFSRSEDWLEERGYADLGLTSQRISELLAGLTDDKVNTFFKSWMRQQQAGDNLLFDITSVSTYGKNNLYAERGYNRDHEQLEQINLALLTSVASGLPLWYTMTPGSMADVAVLNYVLDSLKKLEIKRFSFFGDRGFYSDFNLSLITKKGHRFTVPVPSSVAWQKKMIVEHKSTMLSPRNLIKLEDGSIVYGKTIYKPTDYGRTWYHIYFDPTRKNKIVDDFMSRLQKCFDELQSNKLVEKNKSLYNTYFAVKETPKRGRVVEYNDQAIQDFLENDSCYWILMSTCEKDTVKALLDYRKRNDVEVCFDDIKNALDLKRMRNHSEQTIKGKIFVHFIALIILTQLRNVVQKIPQKDRRYWTEHEFLDKVASYTKVHFENKYNDVYTVPTAGQRLVFDLMEIPYTYKGVRYGESSSRKKRAEEDSPLEELATTDQAIMESQIGLDNEG